MYFGFFINDDIVLLSIDINECSASPAPCDVNANCQNTKGSYLCSCKPGFTGDGKTCKGIKKAIENKHKNFNWLTVVERETKAISLAYQNRHF